MRSTLIDVEVDFLHATEKAILVRSDNSKEVWLPKAQCETDPTPENCRRGQGITLTCERALAEEKGLV